MACLLLFLGWLLGAIHLKLEQNNLDYFKDLLNRWLDDLLSQADSAVSVLKDADDYLLDPLDRAVLDINRNYTLRMRNRESILIKKIKKSLEDINGSLYGICEECGSDISIARLNARPVEKRCIKCKTKQEEIEKSIGV